jgi:hypothetical protein
VGEDKYATTQWGGEVFEDLPLPSGQLCLARRVGLEGLMRAGIIHDIDPLMGLVQQHQDRVQGKETEDAQAQMIALMRDDDKMSSLFHLLDRILCHVVIKPAVQMAPNDITLRERGVVYSDTVQMEDKMYIMSWAIGGADAVAGFREEYEKLVGGVQSQQGDEDSAE